MIDDLEKENSLASNPLKTLESFEDIWIERRDKIRKKCYESQLDRINGKAPEQVDKSEIEMVLDLMEMHLESLLNQNKINQ